MWKQGWEWTLQPFFRSPLSEIILSEIWTDRFVLKFTFNAYKWHSNSHYLHAHYIFKIIFVTHLQLSHQSRARHHSHRHGIFPVELKELLQSKWTAYKYPRLNHNRVHQKRKAGSQKAFFPMFTALLRNPSHLTLLNSWQ